MQRGYRARKVATYRGIRAYAGIRKEGSTSASFLLCLRRAVDMILEGIPVAYMGCKGVQKGDKEIRSITESR